MKCPHCLENFNGEQTAWRVAVGDDADGSWLLTRRHCPTCGHSIFTLETGSFQNPVGLGGTGYRLSGVSRSVQVWPRGVSRASISAAVPPSIAEDFKEACLVLVDSPKASAALSRRCLQNVLRETAKVRPGDLYNEIQEALDRKTLPSHITAALDAVRAIGNFGTHPIKSQHTGEVMPVAPGEAEWNLDVLESLFDFYYVQPALLQAKKDALNKKLAEAGKGPIQ